MERKDWPFKSFWGNDNGHRYNEPDSDRGASDEGWQTPKPRANSRFRKHGVRLW